MSCSSFDRACKDFLLEACRLEACRLDACRPKLFRLEACRPKLIVRSLSSEACRPKLFRVEALWFRTSGLAARILKLVVLKLAASKLKVLS